MTQEELADGLGLTFQQVHNYEKGTNRIWARRLQDTASIQQVPISFFLEDAPGQSSILDKPCDYVSQFLTTSDGLALAKAYQPQGGGQDVFVHISAVEKAACPGSMTASKSSSRS